MTVLGKSLIESYLSREESIDRLYITPMLDRKQLGGAAVDMRLGFDFVTVKRGNIDVFDPARHETSPGRFRTSHYLNLGRQFYLHPNEMALGSTLEYVRLPRALSAVVTSRSKWGRLGLVIATATAIHPGFTGTITLELVNHGNVPLVLYPGLAVAQLILHRARAAEMYKGSLAKQIGPHPTDMSGDRPADLDFWAPKRS